MTEQEKKLQRAMLLINMEEAQSDLAHLRVKVEQWADCLENIARKLRNVAVLNPSKADFTLEADLANQLEPDEQSVLNDAAMVNLLQELKATRQKVFNLQLRKDTLTNGSSSFTAAVS